MWILCKMLVSYDYIDTWLHPKIQCSTWTELNSLKLGMRQSRKRWLGAKAVRNKRGSSHCNCHRCYEHPTMCLGAFSISILPHSRHTYRRWAYTYHYNDTSHPIKRYFERAPLMIAKRDRLYSYIFGSEIYSLCDACCLLPAAWCNRCK